MAIYTVFQKKTSTHIIGYMLRNSCLILIFFDTKIPHIMSSVLHVDTVLSVINQRLYFLSRLISEGLASDPLQIIFNAVISASDLLYDFGTIQIYLYVCMCVSKAQCAHPAITGLLF